MDRSLKDVVLFQEGKSDDTAEAHGDFAAKVVDGLAEDAARDVLGGTATSEVGEEHPFLCV